MNNALSRDKATIAEQLFGTEQLLVPGSISAVLARAGVGKTSFLVQMGLDAQQAGHDIIHITVGHSLEQVEAHYDTLLQERTTKLSPPEREEQRSLFASKRAIQALPAGPLDSERLEQIITGFSEHMGLKPALLIIDGPSQPSSADLNAWKNTGQAQKLAVWISATTRREEALAEASGLPQLPEAMLPLVDRAIFLKPQTSSIRAHVIHQSASKDEIRPPIQLSADTLSPLGENGLTGRPAREHTLMSGGLKGAETHFGVCAERWGLAECTFSFAGRTPVRTRGLVSLAPPELKQGDVSWAYLRAKTGRSFKQTAEFRKVVQSIWHQVNQAGEVFSVGRIQPDDTVKGGTGWAVELAKFQHKLVHVYDLVSHSWQAWDQGEWFPCPAPIISQARFAGSGTRDLPTEGKEVIEQLFERSFGPPPDKA